MTAPRLGLTQHSLRGIKVATCSVEQSFLSNFVFPASGDGEKVQMLSQSGPPRSLLPDEQAHAVPLCLPLPLATRSCGCGRPLHVFGHHRSVCAVVGVLPRGGHTLVNVMAHMQGRCRVSNNVMVRDPDLAVRDGTEADAWRSLAPRWSAVFEVTEPEDAEPLTFPAPHSKTQRRTERTLPGEGGRRRRKVIRGNQTLLWRVGEGQSSLCSTGVAVWCHDGLVPPVVCHPRMLGSSDIRDVSHRLPFGSGADGTLPTLHEVVSESRCFL